MGGLPRYNASPDINTEDFQAAIDYLSNHKKVDANRIGIIGICGWGCSLGKNLTRNDTRITTKPGDIVLYQGNQIVMFYGSNTWSYNVRTR